LNTQPEGRDDATNQRKPTGLRNVVRLGYVSLFTDLSTEMILSILPVFLKDQLGASYAIIGIIEGTADAMNDFFRIVTGVLTDRLARRKPLVLFGYALSSFAKPLFAFTTSWGQAFVVRVVDRAGKGARTSPRDALISDSIAKSESGKAFGIHGSLDQVGAVLAPLVAAAAFPLIGFRGVFWLSFAPAAVSLIILVFFVEEAVGLTKQRNMFANAAQVLNRRFVALLVAFGIFAVGAYNFSFILLMAASLGVPESQIPFVYAVLNVATVLLAFPSGVLADKIGKVPVLGLSYVAFFATSVTAIVLTGSSLFAYAIAFLFGGYLGISDTVQRSLIPEFPKSELKGTAYAFYYLIIGSGSFAANSVFGFLWSNVGSTLAFEYTIATSIAGAAALLLFWLVSGK